MAKQLVQIVWVTPPGTLQRNIALYGDKVMAAVKAVADKVALSAQTKMRQNAKWTDRTGNARSGLFSLAESVASDVVVIYLSHGPDVSYGIWLELANAGKYAIIAPTIREVVPELKQMLDGIFK